MKKSSLPFELLCLFTIIAFLLTGCAKKHAVATAPQTPPPPPPVDASLTATPATIQKGQSVELAWQSSNAESVSIDGLGTLPATGTRVVTPEESTTYTLRASGPGGSKESTARVTVNLAAIAATDTSKEDLAQLFSQNIKDVFFDYDSYAVPSAQSQSIAANAQFLSEHPGIKIVLEGHCDERGSDEYNLALGDSRVQAVKRELMRLGVKADRFQVVSYGKEKPFCTDATEQCWQQNRRAHFTLSAEGTLTAEGIRN
jgi:peptidoglycan-associated lipoprotein